MKIERLLLAVATTLWISTTPALAASIRDAAVKASAGLGMVRQSSEGTQGQIVVFEESHNSRAAQIEIAHMLVRLHRQHGLRTIGLEGAFPADGPLTIPWASRMQEEGRLRVSARLLSEGEISSAEFMAVAFPQITVRGIDDPTRYKVELPDRAAGAGTMYLIRMAEPKVSQNDVPKVNQLVRDKKVTEAVDLIIGSDPWAKAKRAQMSQTCPKVVPAEDMVKHLDEIEGQAKSRSTKIDSETRAAMQELRQFYQAAAERNVSLVREGLALARTTPNVPAAMIIGAAHTAGVTKLLREASYAHAVVTPLALVQCDRAADLEWAAYTRKTKGLSVDVSGTGAILDGRKKPQPVVNSVWMRSKAGVYYVAQAVARAAARGERPPFGSLTALSGLEGVKIDPATYRIDDGEVIFRSSVQNANNEWQTVWVRVGCETAGCSGKTSGIESPTSIDARIDALLADARGGGDGSIPPGGGKVNPTVGDPGEPEKKKAKRDTGKKGAEKSQEKSRKAREEAKEIDPGIYVIISKDRADVERPVMLKAV